MNKDENPKFIIINNTRIKISNIKQYGISFEEIKNQGNPMEGLLDYITFAIDLFDKNKAPKKTKNEYLYITTYQGDNYKFFENQINIQKIIAKLDSYLT